jgi:AcrR family transcriptional regulator
MSQEATPGRGCGPRRERKKRQTREALIHTALELFDAKGYENTAVREITDAVDVSERTFFRYFASKEDLAMSYVRDARGVMLEALAERPAEEEPLTALRNATHESLEYFSPDDDGKPVYLTVTRLIDATPSLLAANLRYLHEHDDLIGVLARREGVDPDTDPRPRVLAAVFGGLIFVATRDWRTRGTGSADEMMAAFDAYAAQLGPALAGHWC